MKNYGLILNKVNQEFNFQNFYFNFYDTKSKEAYFELEGVFYEFINLHEIKTPENVSQNINHPHKLSSTATTGLGAKMYENSTNLSKDLNFSISSPDKRQNLNNI